MDCFNDDEETIEMYVFPWKIHPDQGNQPEGSAAQIHLQRPAVAELPRDEDNTIPYAFRSSSVFVSEVRTPNGPDLGSAFLILFLSYFYLCWLAYQYACISDFAAASPRETIDATLQNFLEFAFMFSVMLASGCLYAFLVSLRRVPLISSVLAVIGIRGGSLRSRIHELNAFVLLALNLVTIFTYYTCVYTAEGTRRPGWTEILG